MVRTLLPYEANLWACEAVKRLEVAMEDAIVVETGGTPEGADFMKWYGAILAAGDAKPVHEEEV